MGDGQVESAVADAGPLIHLYEVGQTHLLILFDALCIPDAVWAESVGEGRIPPPDLDNVQRHAIVDSHVEQFVHTHSLNNLHAGERESLFLCHHLDITLLLTDDLTVRDAAKRLQIRPIGSLGIVVKGYKEGLLARSEAEQTLMALYEKSSLFVTPAIVEIALKQLG